MSADPGCGKSVLAKYLVNSILSTTDFRTVCYFFFKDDFEDQRTVVSALCCILRQLFLKKRTLLSDKILDKFDIDGEMFLGSFNEVWNTLVNVAEDENAGEIICLLDAIDECENQGRSQLAQKLCQLYATKRNFNLKFLLTSRPYSGIRRGFQPLKIQGLPMIHLSGESDVEMEKISREIDVFIRARIQDIGKRLILSQHEQDLLLEKLLSVPNRTYLWVHLTLDLIESDIDIDKSTIRELTSRLPKTVDEAYDRILSKSCNFDKARKILHIIVAAARPLTLREMSLVLVLQESHRSYDDLELEFNLGAEDRFREKVREVCGFFVTIIDSRLYLLHQTAKEFLVQNDTANSSESVHMDLKWKHLLRPHESHRILTEICIWHLLLEDFENGPLGENMPVSQYIKDHIFLDYSAKHWAAHFRELEIEVQGAMTRSILRICETSSGRCLTWFRIYWASTNTKFPQGFTSLMMVSNFGLSIAVKYMLKMEGIDLNSRDNTYGRSALSWAAGKGFGNVVKLLINKGNNGSIGRRVSKVLFGKRAKIDSKDIYGRTPLSYAVWIGNVAVIELLIKAGARANSKDKIGGTPLLYALCNRDKEVIQVLLKGDTQANLEDSSKELLCSAAKKGHEDVVRLLLDIGKTELDAIDDNGKTPLIWAASEGHETIVKLLLGTGIVDVNARDYEHWTPLSWATERGDKDMVELLLKAGAKTDIKYTVTVSKLVSILIHTLVESIANLSIFDYYSM